MAQAVFRRAGKILCCKLWNEALGLVASRLQEQADYVTKLAEIKDPAETLKYHTKFVQNSLTRSYNDGTKFFDPLRAKLSSALPGK